MKKYIVLILMFASINMLFVSCKKEKPVIESDDYMEFFESQTEYGMYQKKADLFEYNEIEFQLIRSNDGSEFYISNDVADKYIMFEITDLDKLSDDGKKIVEVNAKSTVEGVNSKHEYSLIKSEDAKHWYWNEENNLGIVSM